MDNQGITRTAWELQRQPGKYRDRRGEKIGTTRGEKLIAKEFKGHVDTQGQPSDSHGITGRARKFERQPMIYRYR